MSRRYEECGRYLVMLDEQIREPRHRYLGTHGPLLSRRAGMCASRAARIGNRRPPTSRWKNFAPSIIGRVCPGSWQFWPTRWQEAVASADAATTIEEAGLGALPTTNAGACPKCYGFRHPFSRRRGIKTKPRRPWSIRSRWPAISERSHGSFHAASDLADLTTSVQQSRPQLKAGRARSGRR